MRGWAFLLGGLLVWTLHFFALYGIASIFLTTPLARILVGIITLLCLAGLAVLTGRSWSLYRSEPDEVSGWLALIATLASAISLVAILWQGLPALLA
jgi:hypothetical protein